MSCDPAFDRARARRAKDRSAALYIQRTFGTRHAAAFLRNLGWPLRSTLWALTGRK